MDKREAIKKLLTPYYMGKQSFSIHTEKDSDGEFIKTCQYHMPNGNRCAFGMAVKDESLTKIIKYEGNCASYIIDNLGFEVLKDEYQKLFTGKQWDAIQRVHDNYFNKFHIRSMEESIPESKGLFTEEGFRKNNPNIISIL